MNKEEQSYWPNLEILAFAYAHDPARNIKAWAAIERAAQRYLKTPQGGGKYLNSLIRSSRLMMDRGAAPNSDGRFIDITDARKALAILSKMLERPPFVVHPDEIKKIRQRRKKSKKAPKEDESAKAALPDQNREVAKLIKMWRENLLDLEHLDEASIHTKIDREDHLLKRFLDDKIIILKALVGKNYSKREGKMFTIPEFYFEQLFKWRGLRNKCELMELAFSLQNSIAALKEFLNEPGKLPRSAQQRPLPILELLKELEAKLFLAVRRSFTEIDVKNCPQVAQLRPQFKGDDYPRDYDRALPLRLVHELLELENEEEESEKDSLGGDGDERPVTNQKVEGSTGQEKEEKPEPKKAKSA